MKEECKILNCEYNSDGYCLNCDDIHNPNTKENCISFIDENE